MWALEVAQTPFWPLLLAHDLVEHRETVVSTVIGTYPFAYKVTLTVPHSLTMETIVKLSDVKASNKPASVHGQV